jgi:hypothetical protein
LNQQPFTKGCAFGVTPKPAFGRFAQVAATVPLRHSTIWITVFDQGNQTDTELKPNREWTRINANIKPRMGALAMKVIGDL